MPRIGGLVPRNIAQGLRLGPRVALSPAIIRRQQRRDHAKQLAAEASRPALTASTLKQMMATMPEKKRQAVSSLFETYSEDKIDEMLSESNHVEKLEDDATVPEALEGSKLPSEYAFASAALQEYMKIIRDDPRRQYDRLFWQSVNQFSKLKPGPEDTPPYEFLVELFEMVKEHTGKHRHKRLKIVGDALYSLNTVRLDPFNEVEYLDSLTACGNAYRAIELWKSRRNKDDVKDSIYWFTVGVLYYLQSRQISRAEQLASEMHSQFDYVQPKVSVGFIEHYSNSSQTALVEKWCEKLEDAVKRFDFELENSLEVSGQRTDGLDQSQAYLLLDRVERPTEDNLKQVTEMLLRRGYWDRAAAFIELMEKCGVKSTAKEMLQVLEATTRNISSKRTDSRASSRSKDSPVIAESNRLAVVISKIIAVHPELLSNPKLYESWFRGLAGLKLYDDAFLVVDAMIERGVRPTERQLYVLIKALLAEEQFDRAMQLLDDMEKQPEDKKGLLPKPSQSTYGLFIQHAIPSKGTRGDPQLLASMVDRMYSRGLRHSSATFNCLLHYHYRNRNFDEVFRLVEKARMEGFAFSDKNYRTIWLIFREYYRSTFRSSRAKGGLVKESGPASQKLDGTRGLFSGMVQDEHFRMSLNIFEYCIQTFLLSGDVPAACAVLCYMETVANVKIPAVLALGVLQIAAKTQRRINFQFPKPAKAELYVDPGFEPDGEPPIEWVTISDRLGSIMGVPEAAAKAELLVSEWATPVSSAND